MRTDHLIRALAADVARVRPVETVLPGALLASVMVVGASFLLLVGTRPDPAVVVQEIVVLIKQLFPVIVAAASFAAALRLARPDGRVGAWSIALAAVAMILLAAVVADLVRLPQQEWYALMIGSTLLFCLTAILLMSLPFLAVSLWVLRRGASTRPALTGAAAGMMSGGLATAIFAIHCIEDSPLFYATWDSLAIGLVAVLGAVLGSTVLRW